MSLLLLSGLRNVAEGSVRPVWFGWRRRHRRDVVDLERAAAAVTRYTVRQAGDWVHVTADVNAPRAWVHWFVDGRWHGRTRRAVRAFYCPPGRTIEIRAVACRYRDADGKLLRGALPQGIRTIEWLTSTDAGTADYRVQISDDGGATWTGVATVQHDGRWRYLYTVGPLTDDTVWQVRVTPRLATGEEGTPTTVLNERIVRPPDPVDVTASYDGGSGQVTLS